MSPSVSRSWPAEAATVPAARRLVREQLRALGRPSLGDDAELLVTELVSNVVLHVGGTVSVAVRASDDEIVLEVTDDSPLAPQLRSFSRTSSTGRGMRLVHSLSADHGIVPREHGKTVWVRLTTTTARRDDDELMASFADVDWLAEVHADGAGEPAGAPDAPSAAWALRRAA